jgi:hypothetical protein
MSVRREIDRRLATTVNADGAENLVETGGSSMSLNTI